METCVLIPHELSIILLPRGRPGKLLEMGATLWANQSLRPGSIFLPDEGRLRLDRLEIFSDLGSQDVRRLYGCFDEVITVDKREVRHCNWVRFLQASSNMNDVNVVAQRVRNRAEFHVIKPIPVNGELKVYFEELMTLRAVDTLTTSSSVLASRLLSPHLLKTSSITSHYNSPSDHLLRRQLTVLSSSEDDITPTDLSMRKDRSSYTSPSSGFDSPSMHHCSRTSTVAPKTNASVSLSDGGGIEADRSRSTTDSPSPRLTAQTDDVILSAEMHRPTRSAAAESCSDDDDNSSLTSGRHSPNWLPGSQDDELEAGDDEADEPKMAPLYSKMAQNALPMVRRKEKTWLPCDVCGKKFDRPSLLKRHMRTHTGEKPHVCDVCFKAFSTSSSLNTHRRIHSGEKPHECPICGKRFTASSNLYYHRMTHKKEKPHKCDLCAKSFPTPGDLKSHMYVHSGSWPYKCDVCNRGFSKQANLKNHLLLHTGDKPHNCDTCGKKFALLCNLKTHIKMHEEETSSTVASPLEQRCDICQRSYVANKLSLTNNQSAGICPECSARHSHVSSSRDTPVSASFSIDSIVAGGGNDSLDGADSTKSSLVDLSKSLASQLQLQQKLAIPSVTRISLPTVAAHAQYYAMAASGLLPSSLQYGSLPRYPIGIPWPSPAQQYGV